MAKQISGKPCKTNRAETYKKGDKVFYFDSYEYRSDDKMKPATVIRDCSSFTDLAIEIDGETSEFGHGRLVKLQNIFDIYEDIYEDIYGETRNIFQQAFDDLNQLSEPEPELEPEPIAEPDIFKDSSLRTYESYEQLVENYRQLFNFTERSDLPSDKKAVLMLHAKDLKNEALSLTRNVSRLRNLIKIITGAD
mgnify:CR=1 FL=1